MALSRAGGVIGLHATMISSALRRVVPRLKRKEPLRIHVNVHHVGGFRFKLDTLYFAVRIMQNK